MIISHRSLVPTRRPDVSPGQRLGFKFAIVFILCVLITSCSNSTTENPKEHPKDSGQPTAKDWPMYNCTVEGHRHNQGESTLTVKNAAKIEEKWRFPPKGSGKTIGVVHATPSIVNGYVYFGTATYAKFYKLTSDGKVVWEYELGDAGRKAWRAAQHARGLVPADGVYTSALVTANSVYFGDGAGIMYCLDRQTGKEKWKVESTKPGFPDAHPANLVMGSPILADGKVIFGGGGYEHAHPLDKKYKCCNGRGFVIALHPVTGKIIWKYDVGPKPVKFDPPLVTNDEFGKHTFHYGPSTSSVWCSPSWDKESNTVFFGTDVHNAPRRPTTDDPRNYTKHSAAVIALSGKDGQEKWITQIVKGDVWNHTLPVYDKRTKQYKDLSIGDTPKIYQIDLEGEATKVVGAGCKNGGFYVLRADNGKLVAHTPVYTGPPVKNPKVDPRMLALPSPIGGLQTGCATDGKRVYTNGIDKLPNPDYQQWWKPNPPTGGRVTAISTDTKKEFWRHERPKIDTIGGTKEKPLFRNVGDPVASGIAIANGLLFCTTLGSNKLLVIDASTGNLLHQIYLGPVFAGPSVSRGRVYIGTGNTLFAPGDNEAFFPKRNTGEVICFGLPSK